MSDTSNPKQKERASKVRRKPERDSVLTPTFAATRQTHGISQQPHSTDGGLLQRQCSCGKHTIAGGICEECQQKGEAASQNSLDELDPVTSPDIQTSRDSTAHFNLSNIPTQTRFTANDQPVQPTLTVNAPDDQYEQEADHVAETVMRMPASSPPSPSTEIGDAVHPTVSRLPAISRIQASGDNGAFQAPTSVEKRITHMQNGGQALPAEEQEFFEERMGYDFSSVRLHTDSNAIQASRDIQAKAFTVGNNIAFNEGAYQPGTDTGRRLLAHELTHVVQQGESQAIGPQRFYSNTFGQNGLAFQATNGYLHSSTLYMPSVQRFGFGDVVDFAGDVVGDVVDMGADAFMAIVSRVAPQLVELIRNGPVGMLIESIQEGIQSWLQSIFGEIDVATVITSLTDSVASVISTIQGVLSGDPAACEVFSDSINSIREFIDAFMENPVVQQVQAAFNTVKDVFQQITSMILSPIFDALMDIAGGVFNQVKELASTISGWISNVRDFLSAAWDWVKEQLGLSGDDEDGIWEWLKEQAAEAWEEIKSTLEPIMGPLQVVVGAIVLLSPVGPFVAAVTFGPPLVEAIQWLWAHKDDPNIVESAHEEMGDTILPQLLSSLQNFGTAFQSAVGELVSQIVSLSQGLLELLGAITGIPLLSMAQSAIQTITDGIQSFATWAQESLQAASESIQGLFQAISQKLQPYIEILSSIGLAIVAPGMIPVILAGWAWRALDDCYKAPIVNFLLDVVIGILEAMPDLPMLGLLWPIVKEAVLGFLEGIKSQDDATKIAITNKLATIISGASLDFIFGFVKGLLTGLWEGLTDPFVLIYTAMEGFHNLINWLRETADQALNPEPENSEAGSAPEASVGERMQAMGEELEPHVEEVTSGFMPAVEEYFTSGEGLTFDDLMQKLGEAWDAVSNALREAGGALAERICEFFMQDSADGEMGEAVGWLAGTIIFEVVLGILTAGTYTAANGVMRVLQTFARVLDWTGEVMGVAFRALSRVGGYIMDLIRGLGRMLNNAGGAVRAVMEALQELGEKLIRFGEELLGFGVRGADDVAGEAAERAAREATEEFGEEAAERAGREAMAEAGEEGAERAGREAAEDTAEEAGERGARNADELEGSPDFIEAKAITELNEGLGTPAPALIGVLSSALPEHRFEAQPLGPGQHRIVMRATLEGVYDPIAVRVWAEELPKRSAPTSTTRHQYQVTHCGPEEIQVRGGGQEVWADGLDADQALVRDAKCIENPDRSPFIDNSACPDFVRQNARNQVADEFMRYGAVINDPDTPIVQLEVIINNNEAKPFFESLMEQYNIPGQVIVRN